MFPIPSLLTVVKYGFISIIVTSAGFLIGNVVVMKHHTVETLDDLVYKPRTSRHLEDMVTDLDREYSKCFTEPTKTYCLRKHNEPFQFSQQREREDDIGTSPGRIRRHPIYWLLYEFSKYMNSLGINAVILEPSMLFCTISSANKYNLLINNFNPHDFQGIHRTVTVGIFEEDAKKLDAIIWEDSENATSKSGFKASRIRRWLIDAQSGEQALYSTHFIFTRGTLEIHAVVLWARNGYFWHSGIHFPTQDLLFENEGTFENFTTIPMAIRNDRDLKLHLPTSAAQFLFQIPNSQYLDCQPPETGLRSFPHPTLTEDQLLNRAIIAIKELKTSFQPYFINFWLWAESLRGWSTACNIFEETFELSIAVPFSSVKRLNLNTIFSNNNYLNFVESHQKDGMDARTTLDCYGLRINIYICYEERETTWYYQKTDENIDLRRVIPLKLRLCSSDVLGQRLNIPCEAGKTFPRQARQAELTTTNSSDQH